MHWIVDLAGDLTKNLSKSQKVGIQHEKQRRGHTLFAQWRSDSCRRGPTTILNLHNTTMRFTLTLLLALNCCGASELPNYDEILKGLHQQIRDAEDLLYKDPGAAIAEVKRVMAEVSKVKAEVAKYPEAVAKHYEPRHKRLDDEMINLYLDVKRAGDEVRLETLMSLMNADRPLLRKIILAEKLFNTPNMLAVYLIEIRTKRPDLYPPQVTDMLTELEATLVGIKDIVLLNAFKDAFRKNPELLLRVAEALLKMNPSMIDDMSAETVAGKLLGNPGIFREVLLDFVVTLTKRPEVFPQQVLDLIAFPEEKGPDWAEEGVPADEVFHSLFRENPEVLLQVAETLLELDFDIVKDIDRKIARRTRDAWIVATMIVIPILSYFIIAHLLQDPNEKRRNEMRTLVKKIEKQKQHESSTKPRTVLVLNDNKSPKAKKKYRKEGKRRKTQLAVTVTVDEDERQKQLWMKGIHRVHLEATVKFRKIRRELDAINLERLPSKQKKKKTKPDPLSVSSVQNLSTAGNDKKAGKSQYIVLVGDPNNLYKTRNI